MADMKTRFFTNVAHEIRTPLSLISGPLETLIEDGVNEDQKKSYLNTINYHTKRLSGLVGQLLDFRKSESGKMTLQVVNTDFSKFVKEIYVSFKDLAETKGVSFELIMKEAEIPLVFDRSKMEIVLFNLLSNAIKYTNNHIQLRISLGRGSIDHLSNNNEVFTSYCQIEVIDNGTGMSQEVMQRIFDRFYQLANIESINLIGTGIGLALTKDIVELHHGSIEVSSEKGKGSVFVVKIPLGADHFSKEQFIKDFKKAEDPSHYQINQLPINSELIDLPQKSSQGLLTLLIVEDNLEIRTFIKAVFSSDYNVIEAVNGRDALKVISKTPPDVIISDLMMPEMDGLAFCKTLRNQESTLHIPLIMLTARTAALVEEKGYDSGVDIFVTKPFSPKVLRAQVESLLNSRKYLREYFNKRISLSKTEDQIPSLDEKFLKRLMKLVENNLTNNELNREFLASSMALSPSTLYRKVKSITGLNITVFIRSIRLKKAAQMIADNEDTISGIAYTVGFNDPKYFRKCFVKQFGVNPSKFNKTLPE
jgi:DNA-binding response OmpR family regulator